MKIKISNNAWKRLSQENLTTDSDGLSDIPEDIREYYNIAYARSPSADPEVLAKIVELQKSDDVSKRAIRNSNCPNYVKPLSPEIPDELKQYYNTKYANSPEADPDILAKIVGLGINDYISRLAARNPNCPTEAR